MQTIYPYLLYDGASAAIDFLTRAFGFTESFRSEENGRIRHAQLRIGDAEVMLGQPMNGVARGNEETILMYVYVDDVDGHCERARAAGAEILEEPADQEQGVRHYHVRDSEGHSWYFAQREESDG